MTIRIRKYISTPLYTKNKLSLLCTKFVIGWNQNVFRERFKMVIDFADFQEVKFQSWQSTGLRKRTSALPCHAVTRKL